MTETADIVIKEGRLVVSGVLNFLTVPVLWTKSTALLADHKELHIDLSAVTAANSAGLALALEWIKYAKTTKKPLSFSHVPPQLASIAAAAGVGQMFQ